MGCSTRNRLVDCCELPEEIMRRYQPKDVGTRPTRITTVTCSLRLMANVIARCTWCPTTASQTLLIKTYSASYRPKAQRPTTQIISNDILIPETADSISSNLGTTNNASHSIYYNKITKSTSVCRYYVRQNAPQIVPSQQPQALHVHVHQSDEFHMTPGQTVAPSVHQIHPMHLQHHHQQQPLAYNVQPIPGYSVTTPYSYQVYIYNLFNSIS